MRCAIALAVLIGFVLHVPHAAAQTFPAKNVRITSVYPAGAGPDIVTRIVAEKLSKTWGRTVLVDPRPAARGAPAIEAVKKTQADGHELLLASNGHMVINPLISSDLNYDTEKDFAPVAMIYRTQFFVLMATEGRHRTIPALIAAARADPGKLIYGIPYVGSPIHLAGLLLEKLTGTQMTAVPFSNQQIFIALANGDIDWALNTLGSATPMLRTNKVKMVAIAAKSRAPALPDIPTIEEAGRPAGMDITAWVAVFAPKATPPGVVQKINADLAAVLRETDVQGKLDTMGFQPTFITPQELTQNIRQDSAGSADLIRRRKFTVQ